MTCNRDFALKKQLPHKEQMQQEKGHVANKQQMAVAGLFRILKNSKRKSALFLIFLILSFTLYLAATYFFKHLLHKSALSENICFFVCENKTI